jgi:hypothetical protein
MKGAVTNGIYIGIRGLASVIDDDSVVDLKPRSFGQVDLGMARNLTPQKNKGKHQGKERRRDQLANKLVSFFVRGGKYSTINVGLCVDILVSVIIVMRRNMHIAHRWIEQKREKKTGP